MIRYQGIDRNGIPRVWGKTRYDCNLAIAEYQANKQKSWLSKVEGFNFNLRVVKINT
jgi:hypothetical protein